MINQPQAIVNPQAKAMTLVLELHELLAGMVFQEHRPHVQESYRHEVSNQNQRYDNKRRSDAPMTPKQKKLMTELIIQRFSDRDEREHELQSIEGMTKHEASLYISSLLRPQKQTQTA